MLCDIRLGHNPIGVEDNKGWDDELHCARRYHRRHLGRKLKVFVYKILSGEVIIWSLDISGATSGGVRGQNLESGFGEVGGILPLILAMARC